MAAAKKNGKVVKQVIKKAASKPVSKPVPKSACKPKSTCKTTKKGSSSQTAAKKLKAIGLLKDGMSTAKVMQRTGFTKKQISSFKAHITMGTY